MLGNTQGGVFLVFLGANTSLHNRWYIRYQKITFISLDSWVRLMSCLICSQSVLDVCLAYMYAQVMKFHPKYMQGVQTMF